MFFSNPRCFPHIICLPLWLSPYRKSDFNQSTASQSYTETNERLRTSRITDDLWGVNSLLTPTHMWLRKKSFFSERETMVRSLESSGLRFLTKKKNVVILSCSGAEQLQSFLKIKRTFPWTLPNQLMNRWEHVALFNHCTTSSVLLTRVTKSSYWLVNSLNPPDARGLVAYQ